MVIALLFRPTLAKGRARGLPTMMSAPDGHGIP
jgi:hypothetical protein